MSVLLQKHSLGLFIWDELSKPSFRFINTDFVPETQVGSRTGRSSLLEAEWASGGGKCLLETGPVEAVCEAVLENANLLLVLQIGNLDDYYHFYHSKTFKRSTLSSRGPHTFLRMDPQVHTTGQAPSQDRGLLALPSWKWTVMDFYSIYVCFLYLLWIKCNRDTATCQIH